MFQVTTSLYDVTLLVPRFFYYIYISLPLTVLNSLISFLKSFSSSSLSSFSTSSSSSSLSAENTFTTQPWTPDTPESYVLVMTKFDTARPPFLFHSDIHDRKRGRNTWRPSHSPVEESPVREDDEKTKKMRKKLMNERVFYMVIDKDVSFYTDDTKGEKAWSWSFNGLSADVYPIGTVATKAMSKDVPIWLRCKNDPSLTHIKQKGGLSGTEDVVMVVEPKKTFLKRIRKKQLSNNQPLTVSTTNTVQQTGDVVFGAFMQRFWEAAEGSEYFQQFLFQKLSDRLERLKKPKWMTTMRLVHVVPGHSCPIFSNIRTHQSQSQSRNSSTVFDVDVEYGGGLVMDIDVGVVLEQMGGIKVSVSVSIQIEKLSGTVRVSMLAAPAEYMWYTFTSEPKLDLATQIKSTSQTQSTTAPPSSTLQVKTNHHSRSPSQNNMNPIMNVVQDLLERKIRQTFLRTVVQPNWMSLHIPTLFRRKQSETKTNY